MSLVGFHARNHRQRQMTILAVSFECPKCGAEILAETASEAIVPAPPTCALGHPPTEMEQRLLPDQTDKESRP